MRCYMLFFLLCIFFYVSCSQSKKQSSLPLVDFKTLDVATIAHSKSLNMEVIKQKSGEALQVRMDSSDPLPGFVLSAPEGGWNLTDYLYVSFDVINRSDSDALVTCRLNGEQWIAGGDVVAAGATVAVKTFIPHNQGIPEHIRTALFGMNGLPGGLFTVLSRTYDVRKIENIKIQFPNPASSLSVAIAGIRADPGVKFLTKEELAGGFFPFVDEFGQNRHAEWEDKIHSVEELKASVDIEEAELESNPGPQEWDKYGGWAEGPQLKATGSFRVEKYRDKWWMVDPEGKLFWSHGINEVYAMGSTPVTDRERYFSSLPPRDKYPNLYSDRETAPFGYYKGKTATVLNMSAYNLMRKYGESWQEPYIARTHKRLRSWGMNTLGAWTPESMYLKHQTPYAIVFHSEGRVIEGGEGHWRKFPDPFDEGWRSSFAKRLAQEKTKSVPDPFCIGYFMDNELTWGGDTYLATGALKSPADQPVKLAFREHLQKKYNSIARLNQAWKTNFKSWQEFLESVTLPANIDTDLREFNLKIARQYLNVCRSEIKRIAPNKLYMGARWDYHLYPYEDSTCVWLLKIVGDYCDVITFNRYRYSCIELAPPEGVDKPIMITEWHIGTLDRGMYHFGLRSAMSLKDQNKMYQYYVRQALKNKYMVGAHWFLYGEQAVSGRMDGENYRVGFVDICDVPYRELVNASREIGNTMYNIRLE